MRAWFFLLSGLLIWAAHFGGIYAIASISETISGQTTLIARGLIVLAGVAAMLTCAILFSRGIKLSHADDLDRFVHLIGLLGLGLAMIAVIWQSLPILAL